MIKRVGNFTTPYAVKDVLREAIDFKNRYGYQDRKFRLVAICTMKKSHWHTPEEVKAYIQKNLQMKECGRNSNFGWMLQVREIKERKDIIETI